MTEIVPDDTDTSTWTENELRPSGLLATAGLGLVTLSWDAPAGDAASVDGYEILRRRTNRGEKALTALVADTGTVDTTYVDRTANEEGVIYAYRVKALRGGVASMWSMFANATGIANTVTFVEEPQTQSEPQPAVVQLDAVCAAAPETELSAWDAMLGPPAIPVDVSATSAPGGMQLSWDGGGSEVTGFRVWRAEVGAEDCMSLLIADTASSDTAFVDGDVSDGAVYGYRIQALRDTAVSEWSQWVHHTYLLSEADTNTITYVSGDEEDQLITSQQESELAPGPDILHFVRSVRPRPGLALADDDLPNEWVDVRLEGQELTTGFGAQGHEWSPTGLWADTESNTIWVVDPIHFGVHALSLSELKKGRIDQGEISNSNSNNRPDSQRMTYACHFSPRQAGYQGNPDLSVIWGDANTLWLANNANGRIEGYSNGQGQRCTVWQVTDWRDTGYHAVVYAYYQSTISRASNRDYSLWLNDNDHLVAYGIWSDGATMWVSGPVARTYGSASPKPPGGIYKINMNTGSMSKASGFEDLTVLDTNGLTSDGTTMWVAVPGWLRAYRLNNGARKPASDIKLSDGSIPQGLWSSDTEIWVAFRAGSVELYCIDQVQSKFVDGQVQLSCPE